MLEGCRSKSLRWAGDIELLKQVAEEMPEEDGVLFLFW